MNRQMAIRQGQFTPEMTFAERVWAITARIPAGRVATYGDIAARLNTRGARAVGAALGRNPYAPDVPCHRVVGHDGTLTGFAGGLEAKRRLLEAEGVAMDGAGRVDLASCRWVPDDAGDATGPGPAQSVG